MYFRGEHVKSNGDGLLMAHSLYDVSWDNPQNEPWGTVYKIVQDKVIYSPSGQLFLPGLF